MTKADWRERMKTLPRATAEESRAIQSRLLAQDWWAAAWTVGLYRAIGSEPATEMLLADLAARSACAAVPVWQPDRRAYGWGRTTASTRWRQGKFRIEEPDPVVLVPPEFLRVLVLPGVAFDFTGGRLGRGGGFFDRLIVQSPAFMIGLCTERCLVESLPMEPHDVRMDAVMTEKRIRFTPGAAVKLEQMINGRYVC